MKLLILFTAILALASSMKRSFPSEDGEDGSNKRPRIGMLTENLAEEVKEGTYSGPEAAQGLVEMLALAFQEPVYTKEQADAVISMIDLVEESWNVQGAIPAATKAAFLEGFATYLAKKPEGSGCSSQLKALIEEQIIPFMTDEPYPYSLSHLDRIICMFNIPSLMENAPEAIILMCKPDVSFEEIDGLNQLLKIVRRLFSLGRARSGKEEIIAALQMFVQFHQIDHTAELKERLERFLAPAEKLKFDLAAFENDFEGYKAAVEKGDEALALQILTTTFVDPLSDIYKTLRKAISKNMTAVYQYIRQDSRFKPSYNGNELFLQAADSGSLEICKLLMEDPRFEPMVEDSIIFFNAIKKRQFGVLRLFMQDSVMKIFRRDLSERAYGMDCKEMIFIAEYCDNGEETERKIHKCLLQQDMDTLADLVSMAGVDLELIIRLAAMHENEALLKLILANERLDFHKCIDQIRPHLPPSIAAHLQVIQAMKSKDMDFVSYWLVENGQTDLEYVQWILYTCLRTKNLDMCYIVLWSVASYTKDVSSTYVVLQNIQNIFKQYYPTRHAFGVNNIPIGFLDGLIGWLKKAFHMD